MGGTALTPGASVDWRFGSGQVPFGYALQAGRVAARSKQPLRRLPGRVPGGAHSQGGSGDGPACLPVFRRPTGNCFHVMLGPPRAVCPSAPTNSEFHGGRHCMRRQAQVQDCRRKAALETEYRQSRWCANKRVTHVVLGKCGRTRQHAQSHGMRWKRTPLPVTAVHALKSRQNSGVLLKKIRMVAVCLAFSSSLCEDKWPAQTKSCPLIAIAVRSTRDDTGQ